MKTTLQTIFEFILSLASLFFRNKKKGKPNQPVANDPGSPGTPTPQYGGSPGGHRSDTLALPAQSSQSPLNMLGWALIVSALGGYLYKSFLLHAG